MKKLLLFACLITTNLFASNYPADYCNQVARFMVDGPVVFGDVSSGCMGSQYVVGYKNDGVLGGRGYVDAVLVMTCKDNYNHNLRTVTNVIRLGQEMHGTGYMSMPINISSSEYCPSARLKKIEIAFFNNNEWDSRNGNNYVITENSHEYQIFKMDTATFGGDIEFQVWDFIVDLMR
ncbi:MAG: hypothetical protein A2381_09310 [Bdellovibrionales bacterium RIFOXYB1_FULL_37_110]|nr:MAG: hypothetical protein A2417_14350 [Bdellovibrionales bacterium RIFOXYC1_FULL_37_79]OFZ56876.1 MAG: hypothetical protein A2381_09310 [Bdellovibrionales bacterium RIFOXYB1_FULL_37_110]OFZ65562.1 MAG: hypothetical protein A2577_17265 [Bdellovibrionales bacterium RIFOXYD1_FULL_36_51]